MSGNKAVSNLNLLQQRGMENKTSTHRNDLGAQAITLSNLKENKS